MNRANFPGRKNRKRIEALERLVERTKNRFLTYAEKQELAALRKRIVPQTQALNAFSKKWRGAGEPPKDSRAS